MKKYVSYEDTLYVGTAYEIKAIYKSIVRHDTQHDMRVMSGAKFNPFKMYGIRVSYEEPFALNGFVKVLSSDTTLSLLMEGGYEYV